MDLAPFRERGDTREFGSDYWVRPAEVDRFTLSEYRTKSNAATTVSGPSVSPDDGLWEDDETVNAGDVDEVVDLSAQTPEAKTDGLAPISDCVKNWKAAQADSKKRVLGMFDETGWFACGCRHGIILWVCDMIRSGEQ